jgi:DNA-binding NtrC family response regulator
MQEAFAGRPQSERIAVSKRTKTILLVEDEPIVRSLLREVLERAGYQVLACERPEDGIAECRSHIGKIDLLLTDVVMPGMNGKEMASHILEMMPELSVIFMSGYTEHVLVNDGILDAKIEYLQKPFSLQTLRQRLERVLSTQPAQPLQ